MTEFEILDKLSFEYISGFGLDAEKIVAVTNWLDITKAPENLDLLFRVERRILKDSTRVAFLIRHGKYAAIFASVAEGYIRLSDGKVFYDGEWVEND